MIRVLFLVMLLGPVTWAASSDAERAVQVQELAKQGKWEAALKELEQIHSTAENEAWAIGEGIKLLYQNQRWSRFFGLVSFARTQSPNRDAVEEYSLLEILALLRHCQKDLAIERVKEGLERNTPAARPRYEMLASLLEVAATAPDETPTEEARSASEPKRLFDRKNTWPVKAKAMPHLNPWKLERKVEPLCEKEKGATK